MPNPVSIRSQALNGVMNPGGVSQKEMARRIRLTGTRARRRIALTLL